MKSVYLPKTFTKMAEIKIYSDIQSEDEKAMMRFYGGVEGVSYKDIDEFLAHIPAEDNAIDIRLHCNGGSVTEGWAMYDKLRASGKEITATAEGTCASMATIILMAAPKERRKAYENAHILLHNPYMMTAALGDTATADELAQASKELQSEQTRMVDLYVERCGMERAEVIDLMAKDSFIDTTEALRLGVIGYVIPPMSASAKPKIKFDNMKENLFGKMMRKLGFSSEAEAEEALKGQDLNTADGQVLSVDSDGAPQVGDAATPDGEWLMPDGSTIVVENGYIVEIREADAPLDEADDEQKGAREDPEIVEEVVEEIIEDPKEDDEVRRLRERVDELEARVDELEAENAELRRQLDEATAKAKTEEDEKILGAVALAGGIDALAQIKSTYKPESRQPQGARVSEVATADEIIARQRKAYGKK